MWYVVQTKTGEESRVVELMKVLDPKAKDLKCIVPLFEQVRRNSGSYKLRIRRLFPGYILVDTEDPLMLSQAVRKVPEFTKVLGTEEKDQQKTFIPVGDGDAGFLDTFLNDGILRLSYISLRDGRVERVIGPLSQYTGNITRLDIQHRRAIVEKEAFGKRRRIYFGLWIDGDPENAWISEQIESGETGAIPKQAYDIGIHEGDMVRGINGMYEEGAMKVVRVDAVRRRLTAEVEMFGRKLPVLMSADNVEKI